MFMRKCCGLLFVLLISCSPRGTFLRVNSVQVEPFFQLELDEKILVNIPQDVNQKDYNTFLAAIPIIVKQRGFREVWDTDEYEMELRAGDIADFTLERNIKRLYEHLGVYYFLDVAIVSRKPFRYGSLSSQLEYREQNNPGFVRTRGLGSETDHRVITRYTLYRTDQVLKLAEVIMESTHLQDNTLDQRVIQREVQEFFNLISVSGG